MEENIKQSTELLRELLGSVNMDSMEKAEEDQGVKLSETDTMDRAIDSENYYDKWFKRILNLFIYEQLLFLGTKAQNIDQVMFCRGTINGLYLIKEKFIKEKSRAQSRFEKKEENPAPFNIL